MDGKNWILFDAGCGLCRRTVAWVRRKDVRQQFYILGYQNAPSPPMTPTLFAACEKAVHVLTPEGHTLRAGRACLFILERLGWKRTARLLRLPPFLWFVEIGYWIVAHNRDFFANFLFRHQTEYHGDAPVSKEQS